MSGRVLVLLSDTEAGGALCSRLKMSGLGSTMGSPVRGADLLAEGPWDVVVGDAGDLTEVEGGFGGEALLTAVLSQDLFCQTVFYGKGIGVSEAVDLMRGGACLVVSREESGLEGLAWAVEEAWSERLADVRLAMEHGLE